MTQAENEIIEAFKRELALALRRITGRKIDLFPEELPTEVQAEDKPVDTEGVKTNTASGNPEQDKQ
jgi:hypothetical protein